MKAGTLILLIGEIGQALKAGGYIDAAGDLVEAKWSDVQADVQLGTTIEALLKAHGVTVPPKVDEILQLLPLLVGLFK